MTKKTDKLKLINLYWLIDRIKQQADEAKTAVIHEDNDELVELILEQISFNLETVSGVLERMIDE